MCTDYSLTDGKFPEYSLTDGMFPSQAMAIYLEMVGSNTPVDQNTFALMMRCAGLSGRLQVCSLRVPWLTECSLNVP
jgi:hypothetical protein